MSNRDMKNCKRITFINHWWRQKPQSHTPTATQNAACAVVSGCLYSSKGALKMFSYLNRQM